ncbi:8488_t:CDS:1 [Ambispora leptoticha]|uniref:8488_t:CDS:1 n=1 Tax=Ambispora leptoticha TaxID=144679 RepID=A0A9N9HBL4_9GLOM|nr:8488_t:CDS:1 [Ambispora leptoticha]
MPKHRQNRNHNSALLDANETLIFQAINVPSPYDINNEGILKKYSQIENTKKPPNRFLLYRVVITHILIDNNIRLSAKSISQIASKKWETETNSIKEEYNRFAEDIKNAFFTNTVSPSKKKSKKQFKFRYDKLCSSSAKKYCELVTTRLDHNTSTPNPSDIDSITSPLVNGNSTISETSSLSNNTKLVEYDEDNVIFANIGHEALFCEPVQSYEASISMNDPGYFPLSIEDNLDFHDSAEYFSNND